MSRSTIRKIRPDLDFAVAMSGSLVARAPDGHIISGAPSLAAAPAEDWSHEEVTSAGTPVFALEGPKTHVRAAVAHLRHRISEVGAVRDLRQELLRNYQQILRFEAFAVAISVQASVADACRILNESATALVEANASILLVRSRGGDTPSIIYFDDVGQPQRFDGPLPVPADRWDQLNEPVVSSSSRVCVPILVGSTRPGLLVIDRANQADWSAGDVNILAALGKLGSSIIPGIANRVSQQRLVSVRAERETKVVCETIQACVGSIEEPSVTISAVLMRPPHNLDLDPNAIPMGNQYRLLFLEALFDARHQAVFMEDGGIFGITAIDANAEDQASNPSSVVRRFAMASEELGLDIAPGGVAVVEAVSAAVAAARPAEVWQRLDQLQRGLADGAVAMLSFPDTEADGV